MANFPVDNQGNKLPMKVPEEFVIFDDGKSLTDKLKEINTGIYMLQNSGDVNETLAQTVAIVEDSKEVKEDLVYIEDKVEHIDTTNISTINNNANTANNQATQISNYQAEYDKTKASVDSNVVDICNKLTEKGVDTPEDSTFEVIAENIGKIKNSGVKVNGQNETVNVNLVKRVVTDDDIPNTFVDLGEIQDNNYMINSALVYYNKQIHVVGVAYYNMGYDTLSYDMHGVYTPERIDKENSNYNRSISFIGDKTKAGNFKFRASVVWNGYIYTIDHNGLYRCGKDGVFTKYMYLPCYIYSLSDDYRYGASICLYNNLLYLFCVPNTSVSSSENYTSKDIFVYNGKNWSILNIKLPFEYNSSWVCTISTPNGIHIINLYEKTHCLFDGATVKQIPYTIPDDFNVYHYYCNPVSVYVDGYAYMVASIKRDNDFISALFKYDVAANTWKIVHVFNKKYNYAGMTYNTDDHYIYLFGGVKGQEHDYYTSKSMMKFEPAHTVYELKNVE